MKDVVVVIEINGEEAIDGVPRAASDSEFISLEISERGLIPVDRCCHPGGHGPAVF